MGGEREDGSIEQRQTGGLCGPPFFLSPFFLSQAPPW